MITHYTYHTLSCLCGYTARIRSKSILQLHFHRHLCKRLPQFAMILLKFKAYMHNILYLYECILQFQFVNNQQFIIYIKQYIKCQFHYFSNYSRYNTTAPLWRFTGKLLRLSVACDKISMFLNYYTIDAYYNRNNFTNIKLSLRNK